MLRPITSLTRAFHTTSRVLNGSVFGSFKPVADQNDPNRLSNRMQVADEFKQEGAADADVKASVTVENDVMLQKYINKPVLPAKEQLLSPLKLALYEANVKKNGFFKNNTVVTHNGTQYKLKLTKEEVDVLEPSVYVKSYRIKSSMKKATQLLRLINGLDVNAAITQCHFSDKKIARDVAELLERGSSQGALLGIQPGNLYISQIWTGSDGYWQKRVDIKARGRNGMITHPSVHVRAILKDKTVTKKRLEYETEQKKINRKPWVQLENKPIRNREQGFYKW